MTAVAGSVFQRKDRRWVAVYKQNGKRKMVYGKTEKDAITKRQDVLNEINGPLFLEISETSNVILSDILLGEWLNEWLISYVKPYKSVSTYTGYEVYINRHIIPDIGVIKLCALNPQVFHEFFNKKSINGRLDGKPGGMSPKSMENMKFMLSAAMKKAVENKLIAGNYVSNVLINDIVKKEAAALTPDEEGRLIAVCKTYHNISAYGIIIALRAGLQLGELLALEWNNIDMLKKEIHVRNSLNRCFDISDNSETKSVLKISASKAERIINENDLPVNFFTEIETYMSRQNNLFDNPDVVVASRNGGFVDPGNYNKLFKRMLMKSGIANINFDVLQNTFALRYLEQSFNPSKLSKVLGCNEASKSIKKHISIYKKQAHII